MTEAADNPILDSHYERLDQRLETALKTDVDRDTWESLYMAVSRKFPKPETGKIAIKVINDDGYEVMEVSDVDLRADRSAARRSVQGQPRRQTTWLGVVGLRCRRQGSLPSSRNVLPPAEAPPAPPGVV